VPAGAHILLVVGQEHQLLGEVLLQPGQQRRGARDVAQRIERLLVPRIAEGLERNVLQQSLLF